MTIGPMPSMTVDFGGMAENLLEPWVLVIVWLAINPAFYAIPLTIAFVVYVVWIIDDSTRRLRNER
jgi:hypothetical protein